MNIVVSGEKVDRQFKGVFFPNYVILRGYGRAAKLNSNVRRRLEEKRLSNSQRLISPISNVKNKFSLQHNYVKQVDHSNRIRFPNVHWMKRMILLIH